MSESLRPRDITARHLIALALAGLLLGLAGCGGGNDGHPTPTVTATATASPTPTTPPCDLPPPFCGGDFPLNTLQTTSYGPAWADVTTDPQMDFVPCFGPYALCFYADCPVSPDGSVSDCSCYDWYGMSFVLVNAILNLDLYNQTKSQCDADPSSCQVPNGAPVCAAINNGTFLNGAERISTFSLYQPPGTKLGQKDCSDQPGLYAGCMTGPCFGPVTPDPGQKTATIHCDCPNYDGPFQVGQDDVSCDIAPHAWSASYNPNPPPEPCDQFPHQGCVPDAPPPCGCPLYESGTVLPPGSGVDCDLVCQQYAACKKQGDIELGFTCDATICTSTDHDLVFAACSGLEKCQLGEIFKAEQAAQCSCCASQLCGCEPDAPTNVAISALNGQQRDDGDTPQCDINGTLCGAAP